MPNFAYIYIHTYAKHTRFFREEFQNQIDLRAPNGKMLLKDKTISIFELTECILDILVKSDAHIF